MEAYIHDGASWQKSKYLYMHDGAAWQKVKELYVSNGGTTWRCAYQSREFVLRDISGSPDVWAIVADSSGGLLAATSSGVYQYSGGSWSAIGSAGVVSSVLDVAGTYYAASISDVRVYSGGSWVAAGTPAASGVSSMAMSSGGLLACKSSATERLVAGTWSSVGIPTVRSVQTVGGTCYGTARNGVIYNMDTLSVIVSPSVGTLVTVNIHVNSATDMYTDGTYGIWKYDGATYAVINRSDCRLMQAAYWGGTLFSAGWVHGCSRISPAGTVSPLGDQTLYTYLTDGTPTAAVVGSSLFVIFISFSPTRYRVYEFVEK